MPEHSRAHEVTFRLTRRHSSVPRARAVLRAAVADWGVGQDVVEAGELILSELVTNALRVRVPSDRQVGVRIVRQSACGLLRLEVSDAGAGEPAVRVPRDDETGGRGLLLVEVLAHRWGVEARAGGVGKTVWAELMAPGIGPAPALGGAEVAAVAVRPGQCVRVWGTWHMVRAVHSEQHALEAVVLTLDDDGPALRLPVGEPLTVRGEGPRQSVS
ncbi:ATP-binding protein [Streptomyces sp. NPDC093109]|uniref:ATP-binding protein n=1 Tax=Streptomyces sp. NPDC093109 TaxID=3154977 RepID=UPI00344D4784